MKSTADDATAELTRLEARLVAQDRRLWGPLETWWTRKTKWPDENDPRRKAASDAVRWWSVRWIFLSSGVGTGFLALLIAGYTAYSTSRSVDALTVQNELLGRQNASLEAQNELLAQQNTSLVMQNTLAESSRRAGLVFELSAILDRIDAESNQWLAARRSPDAFETDGDFRLSDHLVGRIVALSRSLKPYRYLELEPDRRDARLTGRSLSPERGQLLVSLYATPGGALRQVVEAGADFSYADLRNAQLPGADLREAFLVGADLTRADLHRAKLSGASFESAILREADLSGADLSGIVIVGVLSQPFSLQIQTQAKDPRSRTRSGRLAVAREYPGYTVFEGSVRQRNDLERQVEDYLLGRGPGHARRAPDWWAGHHSTGTIFINADLTDAKLVGASLDGALWDGAILDGASVGGPEERASGLLSAVNDSLPEPIWGVEMVPGRGWSLCLVSTDRMAERGR